MSDLHKHTLIQDLQNPVINDEHLYETDEQFFDEINTNIEKIHTFIDEYITLPYKIQVSKYPFSFFNSRKNQLLSIPIVSLFSDDIMKKFISMMKLEITVNELKSYVQFGILHEIAHYNEPISSFDVFFHNLLSMMLRSNIYLCIFTPIFLPSTLYDNYRSRLEEYRADLFASRNMELENVHNAFNVMREIGGERNRWVIFSGHPNINQRRAKLILIDVIPSGNLSDKQTY